MEKEKNNQPPPSKKYLLLLAATSGFAIMAMELSAARLLAPYFGTSLFVWTNIIGIVMVALSIGYYVGGKLSDKRPQVFVLLHMLLIAASMSLLTPWLVKPLASAVTVRALMSGAGSSVIFLGSFFVTTILFAVPILILGMTSPFVIRLLVHNGEDVGKNAGSVFAVSTVGSILGTFLPSLLLIPTIGTRATIISAAALLLFVVCIGLCSKWKYAWTIFVILPTLFFSARQGVSTLENVVYEGESAYQYIQVVEDAGQRFLLFNEGAGIQSVYDPAAILTGSYYDFFSLIPYLVGRDTQDIAILGLAGGTISRQLSYFFGDRVSIDGVEIDKKVTRVAREYFDLDQPQLTVYNDDGTLFLKGKRDAYDVIIIDAYAQELYIQWTMTTKEFWKDVQKALHGGGIAAININATSPDAPMLEAIINTMASVFPNVVTSRASRNDSFNYLILASNNPYTWDDLTDEDVPALLLPLVKIVAKNATRAIFDPTITLLTNDRAPIEFLTDRMIFRYIFSER